VAISRPGSVGKGSSLGTDDRTVRFFGGHQNQDEALRRKFTQDMARQSVRDIRISPSVAIVTVVAGEMLGTEGFARVPVSGVIRQREILIETCWIRFAFVAGICTPETRDREGNWHECIIRFHWQGGKKAPADSMCRDTAECFLSYALIAP
jgi:hypothetical protein